MRTNKLGYGNAHVVVVHPQSNPSYTIEEGDMSLHKGKCVLALKDHRKSVIALAHIVNTARYNFRSTPPIVSLISHQSNSQFSPGSYSWRIKASWLPDFLP
ncbi:MAG TPA: hypothetical protein VFC67_28355 [Prolixibacteraceae bacterium]|nr:hypothetical protein [Prolixibacteraceae bacterium]